MSSWFLCTRQSAGSNENHQMGHIRSNRTASADGCKATMVKIPRSVSDVLRRSLRHLWSPIRHPSKHQCNYVSRIIDLSILLKFVLNSSNFEFTQGQR